MFEAIGAVVAAERPRTPVRRSSGLAGRCEGLFWRRITAQEAAQIRLGARKYELATKEAGARNGALGGVALEVLDYLTRLIGRNGRLEPSIVFLMGRLRRSRDAIVRALKALRSAGFLDWLRRYIPAERNGGRGPQVQQTSNAYRLTLPDRARRLLGRMAMTPPAPCDFAHRRAAQAAEIEAHERTLSLAELPLFTVEHEGIAAALSRLGAHVSAKAERESASRTESKLGSISKEI